MNKPLFTLRNVLMFCAALALFAGSNTTVRAEKIYASWIQQYDPSFERSQFAAAVAMDSRGNVFVTGIARDANDVNRFYTAKYDALNGEKLWERFESSGSVIFTPKAIAVDSEGDVIVTGARNNGNIDYYTVKYSGSNGVPAWFSAATYNGTASGEDTALKVAVDSSDNIFVTGRSAGSAQGFNIVTIKYNKTTGAQMSIDPYTTAGSRDDTPSDLAIDSTGRVIVSGTAHVGSGDYRLFVRRLSNALGSGTNVTIDTGKDAGAAAVAIDSSNNIVVTGQFRNGSNQHGIYTTKLLGTDLSQEWSTGSPVMSTDLIGGPTDIGVGPDDNPVVTGFLKDANGNVVIRTIKYTSGGFFGGASTIWDDANTIDAGTGVGDSFARQLVVNDANDVIIVGESDTETEGTDIYVAKYAAETGERVYAATFAGSFGSDDVGVDLVADKHGEFAIVGTPFRDFNGTGRNEIATIKFNRFIAASGDEMPDDDDVPANATYSSGNAPALSNSGTVAAVVKLASGKNRLGAIMVQGPAGGTEIVAVAKGAAPGFVGNEKFASFSDPVIAPNGQYAFAAKLSGVPDSKQNGVWSNLGGTLHLVMQQGTPVPGMTENLSSVLGLSMRNTRLLSLVKVAGNTNNVALVSITSANAGTVLLRTGDNVTVGGTATTIKSITTLTPASASPGDGRWQGDNNSAVRATLADGRSAIYRISPGNTDTLTLFTGDTTNAKTLGLPSVSPNGNRFAALVTRAQGGSITSANDSVIYRLDNAGTAFESVAVEGNAPVDPSLSSLTFAGFSDPIINNLREVLFLATLKGQGVNDGNNKALLFGTTHQKIARTGDSATDSSGDTIPARWASFKGFALAGENEATGRPVFLATLTGQGVSKTNKSGIWAVDSQGKVRLILRTGDRLGSQTVKSFKLLKANASAASTARSFNTDGSVAALVKFSDGKQALMKIAVP